MVRTTCPSPPMRMKALGVNGGLATLWAASASAIERAVVKPMRRPPPTAALTLSRRRRERSTPSFSAQSRIRLPVMSGPFLTVRRVLDPLADSHIGTAATDVPGHGCVDIAIGRVGLGGEQRRCGHDLPRLAIAALRHLQRDPGLLNLSAGGCGTNGLDRGDALAGRGSDRRDARAHRLAIEVDRAGAAQAEAAAEFRAGHSEHIAQHPEQRRVVVDIYAASSAVDRQRTWHLSLLK